MDPNDLEFQITQYLDGTLPDQQRGMLEARLQRDEQARRLLEEYRRLDQFLASARHATPLPPIQWDRLAEGISHAIDEEVDRPIRLPVWPGLTRRLALAASVVILLGAGVVALLTLQTPPRDEIVEIPTVQPGPVVMEINGPRIEPPAGEVVVQIGPPRPSAELAAQGDWRYAEGVVARPSSVAISSGFPWAGDLDLPY